MPVPDYTDDVWLAGKLTLRQLKHGQRAGTDAILLAACVPVPAGHVLDVGAGAGAVGLTIAQRAKITPSNDFRVTLVEANAAVAALARHNIVANQLGGPVDLLELDMLDANARRAAGLMNQTVNYIVTNPPFYEMGKVRAPPNADKSFAHMLPALGLGQWLAACLDVLAPQGGLAVIHLPQALPVILGAFEKQGGAILITPIHARADQSAIRILVRARKGSRAPLRLAPPLVLHNSDGTFTVKSEALHRGEAVIDD